MANFALLSINYGRNKVLDSKDYSFKEVCKIIERRHLRHLRHLLNNCYIKKLKNLIFELIFKYKLGRSRIISSEKSMNKFDLNKIDLLNHCD